MTPSLEGLPTKAKEAPSPHEVRLTPLDTNPIFQCLEINMLYISKFIFANKANNLQINKQEEYAQLLP